MFDKLNVKFIIHEHLLVSQKSYIIHFSKDANGFQVLCMQNTKICAANQTITYIICCVNVCMSIIDDH